MSEQKKTDGSELDKIYDQAVKSASLVESLTKGKWFKLGELSKLVEGTDAETIQKLQFLYHAGFLETKEQEKGKKGNVQKYRVILDTKSRIKLLKEQLIQLDQTKLEIDQQKEHVKKLLEKIEK